MSQAFAAIAAALLALAPAAPAAAETWPLQVFREPFRDDGPTYRLDYRPLDHAARPWRLCVLYPHLKDAYWLSVNYGMVEEARRLGVSFDLFEAGGYPNLARQIAQLRECADPKYDAVIVGTVSYDGLTPTLREIARKKPIVAVVNDIEPGPITAKASVPWREMGRAAGLELSRRHPKGSPPVRVAWFPGPEGAGWVSFVEAGFREGIAGSSARIVRVLYGDTGREAQAQLVEQLLVEDDGLDYLVGPGPMAEVAISILRARGELGRTGIISTYISHGVFRGVLRGRILAAPTDFPVVQGKLGIEMAARALEGKLEIRHAGPAIVTVTPETAKDFDRGASLAPASFAARFSYHGGE
ncbi:TMAO reductase system periplasmic protein TorT [Paracoccus aminovorans]|uniref:TMAO reductase system periplasmic protein TorT n=1 Tax=Paracoccus aminovorans TaxID=34004 RepID=UPI002B260E38|nr:TMAO reductase system periplasmic protein TorT [Paracoccus aminovorans]